MTQDPKQISNISQIFTPYTCIYLPIFLDFFQGLLFKDLASPYYLGKTSRGKGYWWKLKPDYDQSGSASDIDLLILGGRYADGFDKRGVISSLILGCLDERSNCYGDNDAKFIALTKVKFGKNSEQGEIWLLGQQLYFSLLI